MSDFIQKFNAAALTHNGQRARSTDEQIIMALGPLFVAYPNIKASDEMLNLYTLMLRDLAPDLLARAVLAAIAVCKFPPTIAEIREQAEQMMRPPGPHSPVDPRQMPPVPTKMFRLAPD